MTAPQAEPPSQGPTRWTVDLTADERKALADAVREYGAMAIGVRMYQPDQDLIEAANPHATPDELQDIVRAEWAKYYRDLDTAGLKDSGWDSLAANIESASVVDLAGEPIGMVIEQTGLLVEPRGGVPPNMLTVITEYETYLNALSGSLPYVPDWPPTEQLAATAGASQPHARTDITTAASDPEPSTAPLDDGLSESVAVHQSMQVNTPITQSKESTMTTPAPQEASPVDASHITMHHTADQTVAVGVRQEDSQIRAVLKEAGFRWAKSQQAWYLSNDFPLPDRAGRVDQVNNTLHATYGTHIALSDLPAPIPRSAPAAAATPAEAKPAGQQARKQRGGIVTSIVGNLADDPVVGFNTETGNQWTRLTVTSNERERGQDGQWQDGPPTYTEVIVFGSQAEPAAMMNKGDRVHVEGRPEVDTFQRKDGTWSSALKVFARNVEAAPLPTRQDAADAAPAKVTVHNTAEHTYVTGVRRPDTAVQQTLKSHGFTWSSARKAWALPASMPAAERTSHAQAVLGEIPSADAAAQASLAGDEPAPASQGQQIAAATTVTVHNAPDGTRAVGPGVGSPQVQAALAGNGFTWDARAAAWSLPEGMPPQVRSQAAAGAAADIAKIDGQQSALTTEPAPIQPGAQPDMPAPSLAQQPALSR